MTKGKRIFMQEVGPRDGLQAEPVFVPTERKVALIDALSACGFAKIEVTSFASPKAIPALADASEVTSLIERRPGTVYVALVPNLRGAERALACGVDELNLVMSVSETHNLANLNMTQERSFGEIRTTMREVGASAAVTVSLSTAFGCALEGRQGPEKVLSWAERYRDVGVASFTLCDTSGMANPTQVTDLVRRFRLALPDATLALHFHDTRGMALANAMAAVDAGADRFEASIGGLGGCPYMPGATGNACTEDLVNMLEDCGYDTAVALGPLLEIVRGVPKLLGHALPGHIVNAAFAATVRSTPSVD